MLKNIKYITAYQSQPISAITHYAPLDRIKLYGESGKYKLIFSEKATKLDKPIPLGDAPPGTMQGPRYTSLGKLKSAKKYLTWLVSDWLTTICLNLRKGCLCISAMDIGVGIVDGL